MAKNFKPVLLEIKIPNDVVKPIRAMENVMAGIHQACFQPPNWAEEWIDGQVQLAVHFEIASLGGEIHFYVRFNAPFRQAVEANIYSQYPGVEITEAEDYTKFVPPDIPNKDWDMWGADYRFLRENPYPILTYRKFETETEPLEEKRIDPISVLMENMAKVRPGEQLWVQISAEPLGQDSVKPFMDEADKLRDKLAKRPEAPKEKNLFIQALETMVTGKPPAEEEKEEAILPPEMRLTPGEREVVEEVEHKSDRPPFSCNIRFIWLGKKEVWFKGNFRLAFGFFANFNTLNLNALQPYGKTMTKVKSRPPFSLLDKKRIYLRQRKLFRNYKDRVGSLFPLAGRWPINFVLNVEELASLYHFPSWLVSPVPGVSRVEIKKGPPSELPVE